MKKLDSAESLTKTPKCRVSNVGTDIFRQSVRLHQTHILCTKCIFYAANFVSSAKKVTNESDLYLELVDGVRDGFSALLGGERHRQLALARHQEVRGLVLVGVGVATHDDGLRPGGDESAELRSCTARHLDKNLAQNFDYAGGIPIFGLVLRKYTKLARRKSFHYT